MAVGGAQLCRSRQRWPGRVTLGRAGAQTPEPSAGLPRAPPSVGWARAPAGPSAATGRPRRQCGIGWMRVPFPGSLRPPSFAAGGRGRPRAGRKDEGPASEPPGCPTRLSPFPWAHLPRGGGRHQGCRERVGVGRLVRPPPSDTQGPARTGPHPTLCRRRRTGPAAVAGRATWRPRGPRRPWWRTVLAAAPPDPRPGGREPRAETGAPPPSSPRVRPTAALEGPGAVSGGASFPCSWARNV